MPDFIFVGMVVPNIYVLSFIELENLAQVIIEYIGSLARVAKRGIFFLLLAVIIIVVSLHRFL